MSPSGGSANPSGLEFPSQRRERVDWHKLASIDLRDLTSGCPIEVLQENLTQVAFCDAEVEFDLGSVAGQRNLKKMFRLAQLMVQYLFLSQDFMETQLKEAQEEAQQVSEKYQQVKAKLVQQVEEAKKMKATNRNMRETVKQINSFAIANGIFQAQRCPQCPKTFRSHEFLQSHLWRKHPTQATSVTLPQAAPITLPQAVPVTLPQAAPHAMSTVTVSPAHITLMPSSATPQGANASVTPQQMPHLPSTTTTDGRTQEPPPSTTTLPPSAPPSVPCSIPAKVNDVDSYRLNEVERKCDTMNDNLLRLCRELEGQKRILEADHSRKQEEVKKAWEEKRTMEEYYEAQLEKLSRQVSQLQSSGVAAVAPQPGDDDLRELVRRQEEEVRQLQQQIQSHALENRVEEIRGLDDVSGLSEELQKLRSQLHQQEVKHKKSLKEMQDTLQTSYEKALNSEKDRLRDMMKGIAHEEAALAVVPHKPPPSPKANKSRKPPTPNFATKPSGITRVVESSPVTPPQHGESSRKGRATPQPQHTLTRAIQPHLMDAEDTESESKSDTDTSYWNQRDLKVKHLQISSSRMQDSKTQGKNSHKDSSLHSSQESEEEEEEEEESQTDTDASSESLRLDALLKDNPHLWGQMKEATSEVLASRLSSLGIDPSCGGIKTETLTACLSRLRKERRSLERKHENFHLLRKRIENEVRTKVDDKIDSADDAPHRHLSGTTRDGRRGTVGVLSRMVKNVKSVQSRVKERSRGLASSVSKTGESVRSGVRDIFQAGSKGSSSSDAVQVLSGSHGEVIEDASGREGSSEEEEEEESSLDSEPESSSARVEVHNETLKSVRRNLFAEGPGVASGSGTRPRHSPGYFDNNTYGREVEEEGGTGWDSEPEYENMKEEPPKRSDSLRLSLDSADLHSTSPRDTWQPVGEPQPIRVKRPSGEKVSGLTRTIELQLSGRKKTKLAGAVDVTKSFEVSGGATGRAGTARGSPLSTQDLQSASDSSNTIATSMWGSEEAMGRGVRRPTTRASTSRATVHSWDSEEDLDISDLE